MVQTRKRAASASVPAAKPETSAVTSEHASNQADTAILQQKTTAQPSTGHLATKSGDVATGVVASKANETSGSGHAGNYNLKSSKKDGSSHQVLWSSAAIQPTTRTTSLEVTKTTTSSFGKEAGGTDAESTLIATTLSSASSSSSGMPAVSVDQTSNVSAEEATGKHQHRQQTASENRSPAIATAESLAPIGKAVQPSVLQPVTQSTTLIGNTGLVPGAKYVIVQASSRIQAQNTPAGGIDNSSSSAQTSGSAVRSFKLFFADQSTLAPTSNSNVATSHTHVASLLREPAGLVLAPAAPTASSYRGDANLSSNMPQTVTLYSVQPDPASSRPLTVVSGASVDPSSVASSQPAQTSFRASQSTQPATELLSEHSMKLGEQSELEDLRMLAAQSHQNLITIHSGQAQLLPSSLDHSRNTVTTIQPNTQAPFPTTQSPLLTIQTTFPNIPNSVSTTQTTLPTTCTTLPANQLTPVPTTQTTHANTKTTFSTHHTSQHFQVTELKAGGLVEVPNNLLEVSLVSNTDQSSSYIEAPTIQDTSSQSALSVEDHAHSLMSLADDLSRSKMLGVSAAVGGSQAQAAEDDDYPTQVTWNNEATLKLIELYKEHQVYLNDHHYKKKSVWEIMASRLRKETPDGTQYRWNQVENKWKNMTKKYRDCVDNNRRHNTHIKCRFYDELAAVYAYNPDEQAQKTAAEGLRALSSSTGTKPLPQKIEIIEFVREGKPGMNITVQSLNNDTSKISAGRPATLTKAKRPSMDDDYLFNGSASGDIPLLAKKKKYARLDATTPSAATTPAFPTQQPASTGSIPSASSIPGSSSSGATTQNVEYCKDVLAALQQLREDRKRQEKERMSRLEAMHREKMHIFTQFLDLLKQSKQS